MHGIVASVSDKVRQVRWMYLWISYVFIRPEGDASVIRPEI